MPLVYSFQSTDGTHAFRCPLSCQVCEGRTKTGAPCRKRVCIGVPLCWQHLLASMHLRIKPSTHPPGKGLFAMLSRGGGSGTLSNFARRCWS